MHTSLISLAVMAVSASASYVLEDDYSTDSFASMFDFFTGADPTNGYVNYVSYADATSSGLYKVENGSVYMGVDSTNVATGRGRDSIRLATQKTYNHGLIILDLEHMPAGACGTWPAFWMLGPDWPNNGEIDIIEGVNTQNGDAMTLHTDAGCSITNTGAFSGTMVTDNCDTNAPGQAANAGCSISDASSLSFGNGFNGNGGGVFATEWTSEAISIYFFPRGAIPSDIASGNPNPSGWGLPQAQFAGACDIDEHVQDQQLVFDVTFCGDWAGAVWSTDATCAPLASTCQAYVQDNPSAFQDTYWLINSLKVYTDNGAAAPSASVSTVVASTAPMSAATATTASTGTTLVTITSTSGSASVPVSLVSTLTSTESTPTTVTLPSTNTPSPTNTLSTQLPLPTTFVTVTAISSNGPALTATESIVTASPPALTPSSPTFAPSVSTVTVAPPVSVVTPSAISATLPASTPNPPASVSVVTAPPAPVTVNPVSPEPATVTVTAPQSNGVWTGNNNGNPASNGGGSRGNNNWRGGGGHGAGGR